MFRISEVSEEKETELPKDDKIIEPKVQLSSGQQVALDTLLEFLHNSKAKVALLQGKPGTGKTFVLKELLKRYKYRAVCTAPTNKATKVLADMLTSNTYKPDCCTIFKLLNLTMSSDGEVKELKIPNKEVDISRFSLVIIDEAFMINSQLKAVLDEVIDNQNIKLLFIGDEYQLPPIGEPISAIKEYFTNTSNPSIMLNEVMRHSGNILSCVNEIRQAINFPMAYKLPFLQKFRQADVLESGVTVITMRDFLQEIQELARDTDDFVTPGAAKVIAWRNATVNSFNKEIRKILFPNTYFKNTWEIGDRVTVTEPAKNLEDKIFATVDEEGTIQGVAYGRHMFLEGINVYSINVLMDDNLIKTFTVVADDSLDIFNNILSAKRLSARQNPKLWKEYWGVHEAVHYIKHSYAITAHRAQGSTYTKVFCNLGDILSNRNTREALQCLNVAMSRAKDYLIIGK